MLSLLALVILVATLTTIFYMQLSLTVGSVTFAVVWLLCGLLASWLYNPILLILLAAALVVLNHPGLRRKLISKPVSQALGKMMPPATPSARPLRPAPPGSRRSCSAASRTGTTFPR